MNKEEKTKYWLKSSDYDWKTAAHLFEKGDYPYALFFGHLTIEKLLKAFFVNRFDETPPLTHRLAFLAERIGLDLSAEKLGLLELITDFNLEARYPDEKFSFYTRHKVVFGFHNQTLSRFLGEGRVRAIKQIRKPLRFEYIKNAPRHSLKAT